MTTAIAEPIVESPNAEKVDEHAREGVARAQAEQLVRQSTVFPGAYAEPGG